MNSLRVLRDLIVLDWDGTIPPDVPAAAIHSKGDILHFWPHVKEFARYSKKFDAFCLDLSAQNLVRIHKQFGRIPVSRGQHRIDELKQRQAEFKAMMALAERIKAGQLSVPVDYKVPPLGDYQRVGVNLLVLVPRLPLFADCGMGKTYMGLVSTEHQIKHGIIPRGKTLICVKLPTLETGWLEDCAKFTSLKIASLWVEKRAKTKKATGSERRKELVREALQSDADLFVINHEGVMVFADELTSHGFRRVILDESTILKKFHGQSEKFKSGAFGRALVRVAHRADWRAIMTGTPAPNGPEDLWGQMHFLDPAGFLLEPTVHDFRRRYMNEIKFGKAEGAPSTWKPKKEAPAEIHARIQPLVYRLRARDHLNLPPLTIQRRLITMDRAQEKHYRDMKKAMATTIQDKFVAVDMKLTQMLKLRQITGGFLRDSEEVDHALPANPKLRALDDLLREEIALDEKVVIWAQYRWEVELIERRYKERGIVSVYGGNYGRENLDAIKRFRADPTCNAIVLHPKSAAHGITFTMAAYMVFYSISHSEEENYQCLKRIDRAGQARPMSAYYLLAKDSIDTIIYQVLETKKRNQEQLIDQREIDEELVRAMESLL